jgi:WD40 repeat protein
VGISKDGLHALTGGRGEAVALWDLERGELEGRYFNHWNALTAAGFGPDESTIVSSGVDGEVMLHDRVSANLLRRKAFSMEGGGIIGLTYGAAILPGTHRTLVSSWGDGNRLHLIDLAESRTLAKFAGHQGMVTSVTTDRVARRAVSQGLDGTRFWDLDTGSEVGFIPRQGMASAMDPAGAFAILGDMRGTLRIQPWPSDGGSIALATETRLLSVPNRSGFEALAFAPDGRTLYVASRVAVHALAFPSGDLLRSFEVTESPLAGKLLFKRGPIEPGESRLVATPRLCFIQALAVSPDGERLLTWESGEKEGLRLWDTRTGAIQKQILGRFGDLGFSFDGARILVTEPGPSSRFGTIDPATGSFTRLASPNHPPGILSEIHAVLTTGHDAPSGARLLAYSPDARWVLAAFIRERKVSFWNAVTNREQRPLGRHRHAISVVALSLDAAWALSGDEGGYVSLWSTFGRGGAQGLMAHQGRVVCAAFLPDGHRIATAGEDGVIRLWKVGDLSSLGSLKGSIRRITQMTVSPDGKWILAVDQYDSEIHAWKLPG